MIICQVRQMRLSENGKSFQIKKEAAPADFRILPVLPMQLFSKLQIYIDDSYVNPEPASPFITSFLRRLRAWEAWAL